MESIKSQTIKIVLMNGLKMLESDKDVPPGLKKLLGQARGIDPSSIEFTELGDTYNEVRFTRPGEDAAVWVKSSSQQGVMATFVDGEGRMRTILVL